MILLANFSAYIQNFYSRYRIVYDPFIGFPEDFFLLLEFHFQSIFIWRVISRELQIYFTEMVPRESSGPLVGVNRQFYELLNLWHHGSPLLTLLPSESPPHLHDCHFQVYLDLSLETQNSRFFQFTMPASDRRQKNICTYTEFPLTTESSEYQVDRSKLQSENRRYSANDTDI